VVDSWRLRVAKATVAAGILLAAQEKPPTAREAKKLLDQLAVTDFAQDGALEKDSGRHWYWEEPKKRGLYIVGG